MSGAITAEPIASSGSGAPIAYGVLESLYNGEMNLEEIKDLARKAVLAAMERDPGSGNGVNMVTILNKQIAISPRS
jgi:proteasome beta subunit